MPNLSFYGTLQYETIQKDTFGQLLKGEADVLRGYKLSKIKITDAEIVAPINATFK